MINVDDLIEKVKLLELEENEKDFIINLLVFEKQVREYLEALKNEKPVEHPWEIEMGGEFTY